MRVGPGRYVCTLLGGVRRLRWHGMIGPSKRKQCYGVDKTTAVI